MKKTLILIMMLCVIILNCGCEKIIQGRKEIDKNFFIITGGFDKGEDNNIRITVISKSMDSGSSPELSEKKTNIMIEEGETSFEINRKFNAFSSKDVFWGHLEYVLIGEEAAKEGVNQYLDFVIRDHELRLTPKVVIVKGGTSEEAIKKMNTTLFDVSQRIERVVEDVGLLSYSSETTVADIIGMVTNEYTCIHIPCMEMVQKTTWDKEDQGQYDPNLNGYAIFKNEKLLGYLTDKEGRGLNWILDKVDTGNIVAKDKEGKNISLEIIKAKSKVIPKIRGDQLSIKLEVEISCNIAEYQGREDIFTESGLDDIKQQVMDKVKEEAEYVIRYAQTNGADFLQFGDAVYHKYPIKWDQFKDNWEDEFEKCPITISVKTKINRTYTIKNPISYKEK